MAIAANSVITAVELITKLILAEVRAGFVQRLFVSDKGYLLNPPLQQFPLVSLSPSQSAQAKEETMSEFEEVRQQILNSLDATELK